MKNFLVVMVALAILVITPTSFAQVPGLVWLDELLDSIEKEDSRKQQDEHCVIDVRFAPLSLIQFTPGAFVSALIESDKKRDVKKFGGILAFLKTHRRFDEICLTRDYFLARDQMIDDRMAREYCSRSYKTVAKELDKAYKFIRYEPGEYSYDLDSPNVETIFNRAIIRAPKVRNAYFQTMSIFGEEGFRCLLDIGSSKGLWGIESLLPSLKFFGADATQPLLVKIYQSRKDKEELEKYQLLWNKVETNQPCFKRTIDTYLQIDAPDTLPLFFDKFLIQTEEFKEEIDWMIWCDRIRFFNGVDERLEMIRDHLYQ